MIWNWLTGKQRRVRREQRRVRREQLRQKDIAAFEKWQAGRRAQTNVREIMQRRKAGLLDDSSTRKVIEELTKTYRRNKHELE